MTATARVVSRVRAGVTLSFEIGDKPAYLGRDKAAAVSLPVEGVSRHHARITWDGKSHWLEDLKSTNATFLNGRAITRERLHHLDVITLGKKVDLVFLRQSAASLPEKARGIVRAALSREGPDATPHEIPPGEVTIGRSQACNIVAEAAAVSKVHARVERTRDQLVLEDLGSANGTFVNGMRVTTAFLNAGDVVSLGGVESYGVTIEMGEVAKGSGRFSTSTGMTTTGSRPRFSVDWKTRYDWSTSEQTELAEVRLRLAEEEKARQEQRTRRNPVVARPSAKEATITPKGPAAPAAKAVEKPAAPAAAPPVAKPGLPVPAGARTAPPPIAAAPVAKAPPPPAAAPAPAPPKPASEGRILEVRLSAPGVDLLVSEPGAHDLGRSSEVPLRVSQPTVSRRHARIILSDDRGMAYVQDQGGANGTRLNGKEVGKLAPLAHGDVIGIGDVELKVELKRG